MEYYFRTVGSDVKFGVDFVGATVRGCGGGVALAVDSVCRRRRRWRQGEAREEVATKRVKSHQHSVWGTVPGRSLARRWRAAQWSPPLVQVSAVEPGRFVFTWDNSFSVSPLHACLLDLKCTGRGSARADADAQDSELLAEEDHGRIRCSPVMPIWLKLLFSRRFSK